MRLQQFFLCLQTLMILKTVVRQKIKKAIEYCAHFRAGKEICKTGLFLLSEEMMERNTASHRRFRDGNGNAFCVGTVVCGDGVFGSRCRRLFFLSQRLASRAFVRTNAESGARYALLYMPPFLL